jgi:hypothetical protein
MRPPTAVPCELGACRACSVLALGLDTWNGNGTRAESKRRPALSCRVGQRNVTGGAVGLDWSIGPAARGPFNRRPVALLRDQRSRGLACLTPWVVHLSVDRLRDSRATRPGSRTAWERRPGPLVFCCSSSCEMEVGCSIHYFCFAFFLLKI